MLGNSDCMIRAQTMQMKEQQLTKSNTSSRQFVVFWGDSTVRFNFKFWVELLSTELTELPDFSLTTMAANMSGGDRPAPPDPTQLFVWHANGTLGGHNVTLLFVGGGIFVDSEATVKTEGWSCISLSGNRR